METSIAGSVANNLGSILNSNSFEIQNPESGILIPKSRIRNLNMSGIRNLEFEFRRNPEFSIRNLNISGIQNPDFEFRWNPESVIRIPPGSRVCRNPES